MLPESKTVLRLAGESCSSHGVSKCVSALNWSWLIALMYFGDMAMNSDCAAGGL